MADDKVRYLEPEQPEFIEQLEELLQRAREGDTLGCTIFEHQSDGCIYSEQLGLAPDHRALIGELSAYSAEITTLTALELIASIGEEGDD